MMRLTVVGGLLFFALFASAAYAQAPIERQFPIAPDILFDLLVEHNECDDRIDWARRSCRGRHLQGTKLNDVTFVVSSAADGSLLKTNIKKSDTVMLTLEQIGRMIDENRAFCNVGRTGVVAPEDVAKILAWAKDVDEVSGFKIGAYKVTNRVGSSQTIDFTEPFGEVSTPFKRIAQRAIAAKKTYTPIDVASIPDEDLQPVTWIAINPLDLGDFAPPVARFINAVRVVLMPTGSKDPAQAIQPAALETDRRTLRNALGASIEVAGVSAAFPTADIRVGRDVVIVYEGEEKRVPITEAVLLRWRLLPDVRQR